MENILGKIPIIGDFLGGNQQQQGNLFGGLTGNGGLLGSLMPNLGIEQLIIEIVIFFIVVEVIFKLIDKI
jgi:hypothetical protein